MAVGLSWSLKLSVGKRMAALPFYAHYETSIAVFHCSSEPLSVVKETRPSDSALPHGAHYGAAASN